jgi:hypothetical protein
MAAALLSLVLVGCAQDLPQPVMTGAGAPVAVEEPSWPGSAPPGSPPAATQEAGDVRPGRPTSAATRRVSERVETNRSAKDRPPRDDLPVLRPHPVDTAEPGQRHPWGPLREPRLGVDGATAPVSFVHTYSRDPQTDSTEMVVMDPCVTAHGHLRRRPPKAGSRWQRCSVDCSELSRVEVLDDGDAGRPLPGRGQADRVRRRPASRATGCVRHPRAGPAASLPRREPGCGSWPP